MNREEINSLLLDSVRDADITADEIPSIDLYLEQIIRLISDKNAQGSDIFSDRVPTKTMVNNYSKAEIITPLKGKTYNKEQIIQILLTNSLKNTLSIAEIKSIMDCIYKNENATEQLFTLYGRYVSAKDDARRLTVENSESIIDNSHLDTENVTDMLLLSCALSALADYYKCMAKSVLNAVCKTELADANVENDPETAEDDKKAAKKAKKAAKKAAKAEAKEAKEAEKASEE